MLGYQMRGVGSTLVTYAISARGSTCVRDKIKGIPFNQGASLGGRNEYPNARRELTAPRPPFPHQGPLNSPDPPVSVSSFSWTTAFTGPRFRTSHWLHMRHSTGWIMPGLKTYRQRFEMAWIAFSTRTNPISRHGFKYLILTNCTNVLPIPIGAPITSRSLVQSRCIMLRYAVSVNSQSAFSMLIHKISTLGAAITERHYLRLCAQDTWILYCSY